MTDNIYISLTMLKTPVDGAVVYMNRYWIVNSDDEVIIWKGQSPQCSRDFAIAEKIRDKMYRECRIEQVDVAYVTGVST